MESRVTRCPHCQTAFRVTDDQLAIADDKVRCGSCLHIFAATDHWADAQSPPETETVIDDDSAEFSIDDGEWLSDDSSEPQALTSEDEESLPHQSPPADDTESSKSLPHPSSDLSRELQEITDTLDSNDKQWTQQLLEDIDNDSATDSDEPASGDGQPSPSDEPVDEVQDGTGDDEPPDTPETRHIAHDRQLCDNDLERIADRREQWAAPTPFHGAASLIAAIEPEPLVLDIERPFGPGMRQLLWGIAAIVAMVVAVGQYSWYHRNELAGDPGLRPVFARVCAIAGCLLPPRDDIQRIHSSNLIVRADPKHPGALTLDVILTNSAPFEQPWPRLRVQFSDLHGKLKAKRIFTPGEYLGGEAAGRRLMPSTRPVHISLLLVDPGANAVNYQIDLLPAGNP